MPDAKTGWQPVPELPEVETVRTELEPALTGRTLSASRSSTPGSSRPTTHARSPRARGRARRRVGRRGKYLVIRFDSGGALSAISA